ncbi:MAG: hypothetical protein AAGA81_04865 [Acidobacteriota bacterium]
MSQMSEQVSGITALLAQRGFSVENRMGRTVWKGAFGGRTCQVDLSRVSRTKYYGEIRTRRTLGFKLDVKLALAASVRHYFVRSATAGNGLLSGIYRFQKKTTLAGPPALGHFSVVTQNEEWSSRFLATDEAVRAAAQLIGVQREDERTASVYFGPDEGGGWLYYASPTLQPEELAPQAVLDVLERAEQLARAADRVGLPAEAAKPSRLERFSKERPFVAAIGLLGCLALPFISLGLVLSAVLIAVAVFL